jgi:hypothetical protein
MAGALAVRREGDFLDAALGRRRGQRRRATTLAALVSRGRGGEHVVDGVGGSRHGARHWVEGRGQAWSWVCCAVCANIWRMTDLVAVCLLWLKR